MHSSPTYGQTEKPSQRGAPFLIKNKAINNLTEWVKTIFVPKTKALLVKDKQLKRVYIIRQK